VYDLTDTHHLPNTTDEILSEKKFEISVGK